MSEQLIISLLTFKLDEQTLGLWESNIKPKELPNYKETLKFLQNRCIVLERCEATNKPIEATKQKLIPVSRTPLKVHSVQQASEEACTICDSSHNVNMCSTMKQRH